MKWDVISMKSIYLSLLFGFTVTCLPAQTVREYQPYLFVFYNLENLFDTKDDPETKDDERTPQGRYRWSEKKYLTKLHAIADALMKLGKQKEQMPSLIGLAEIENRKVLEDLTTLTDLSAYNYKIIQFDSPDERGIDVALLYQPDHFIVNNSVPARQLMHNEYGYIDETRDQLVVTGYLSGTLLAIVVVHWPSRSGGRQRSNAMRNQAAFRTSGIVDSLRLRHDQIPVIVTGDFNDNPKDNSLAVISVCDKVRAQKSDKLYNLMCALYNKGIGSIGYRDQWHLFDQFLVSHNMITGSGDFLYWKAGVFNDMSLQQSAGRYRSYPKRSYSGGRFTAGYSDHFPIYMFLLKPVSGEPDVVRNTQQDQ
ncbi:endonuclease/exonuclease/phosphatase family protein [Robertkochia aurantiaca]|uniref:endonuclease/exonuclease/phosphatase family protein n=1 Tax=Robertkochia aurantiaca TaxID=2873700 RepID=UPI001CCF6C0B|nr:endonuclease/exonuclease/phosphatase family protein [Robertkochia sp. 3YJGBD-33]